jgi:site-specific DNA-methyltransferase (adenine-specific)
MEDSGFNFRDLLVWEKKSAAHRAQKVSSVLSRRKSSSDCETWDDWKLGNLRPIWEPIIWVSKPYTGTVTDTFLEHGVGAFNEVALLKYQNKPNNVFSLGFEKNEKKFHPHQKPLSLTKALIELTTFEGHIVLDPFCGSGTTLLAAKQLKRRFIGYEREADFFRSCLLRLNSSENTESNNDHSN